MDPISIDLSSVAGIVALTVALVHYLKGRLAGVPYLEKVPVAVYVVAVSLGLTWVAHDVLGVLVGEQWELLQQAGLQALAASGVVEWWRAGKKPLEHTEKARDAEARRAGVYVLPIVIALGLGAGSCAKGGHVLVEIDRGIHATITSVDDLGNAACDAKLRSDADCKAFNTALANAYGAYETFNRAVRDGSPAGAPAMLDALTALHAAATSLTPQASALLLDLQQLADKVRALIRR